MELTQITCTGCTGLPPNGSRFFSLIQKPILSGLSFNKNSSWLLLNRGETSKFKALINAWTKRLEQKDLHPHQISYRCENWNTISSDPFSQEAYKLFETDPFWYLPRARIAGVESLLLYAYTRGELVGAIELTPMRDVDTLRYTGIVLKDYDYSKLILQSMVAISQYVAVEVCQLARISTFVPKEYRRFMRKKTGFEPVSQKTLRMEGIPGQYMTFKNYDISPFALPGRNRIAYEEYLFHISLASFSEMLDSHDNFDGGISSEDSLRQFDLQAKPA